MDSLVMRRIDVDNLPELPLLPEGYILRAAEPADDYQLAELLGAAFPDSEWSAERAKKEFTEDPNVFKTFVIEKGDVLVAASTVLLSPKDMPGTGIVHWVGGLPAEKGKRFGYVVVLATLHEFVRIGCKDSLLRTDDIRLPAIKTYLNLGFKPDYIDDTHRARWSAVYTNLGL